MKTQFLWITVAAILMLPLLACSVSPKLIPRELLFGNPEKAQPQISPDGKSIAYLAPFEGVLNIWTRSMKGGDDRPATREKDRGLSNYFWSRDSRSVLFLQDQNGNENTHLYSVELATGAKTDLTPFADVRVQILASEKKFPDLLLIGMNRDNPNVYDAYRLNLRTGELEAAAKNDGKVSGWLADSNLKVRGAVISNTDGGNTVMIREHENSEWKQATQWGFEDSFGCNAVAFTKDGKSIYLSDSRDSTVSRLVQLEIASGKKEILAEDSSYDVTNVMIHPDSREVQMISWIKAKTEWRVLDQSIRSDIETIQKRHGENFAITSRDDADQTWILRIESDQAPVAYFLYHRRDKSSDFLFEHQPKLKKYQLSAIEPILFKSRDGLTLNGYLTLPVSHSLSSPRRRGSRNIKELDFRRSLPSSDIGGGNDSQLFPLVLSVHGGPWSRDVWGYNPRVQWFANRGYAVLQINFRGSTTYGKDFLNAGNKEWGGKMQNDLTDAVAWAVNQGIADPKRIAIFGASYGGYAALAGAAFTPDLFKAAVSVVGPSNLISFLKTTPAYWSTELENIYRRVGHPEKDAEFLKLRSPFFHADQIRIPVLIAQGANDPRVNQAESDQIVEALKRHHIPHEYLLFGDEGHGFAKPENQMKFYKAAETFLAKHLGGRYEM